MSFLSFKRFVSVISISIICAVAGGFILSAYEIVSHRYISYKMHRTLLSTLLDNLNFSLLIFVSSILVLYILIGLLKMMKIGNERVVVKLEILTIILVISYFAADLILSVFAERSVGAIAATAFRYVQNLVSGDISLAFVINVIKMRIKAVAILIGGFVVLCFVMKVFIKRNLGKLSHLLQKRAIKQVALVLVTITFLCNLSPLVIGNKASESGPNVIFIVVDTLRADHLSCYGYHRNTSPHIDRFSNEALFFENALCTAPWTAPSCASMLVAKYPSALGFAGNPVVLDSSLLTLTEIFKENGYKTDGVISHSFLSAKLGFGQGFDTLDEENAKGGTHISSPSVTDKALAILERNKAKKTKFFLFVHYYDPHYDFFKHDKYDYFPGYKGELFSGQPIKELLSLAPTMTVEDVEYIKALYDSEISFTDEHIGMLLEKVRELGLYDESIIVLTGDHGEAFCERGDHWIGHGKTLYQELIHVPLLIKPLNTHSRREVKDFMGLIDLMPTISELAGLTVPKKYDHDGEPFDVTSDLDFKNRAIFSETRWRVSLQAVTMNSFKFIDNLETKKHQFFNLWEDPTESQNVIMDNREMTAYLQGILVEWNNSVQFHEANLKAQSPKFTKEQKEHLKSLGYIK